MNYQQIISLHYTNEGNLQFSRRSTYKGPDHLHISCSDSQLMDCITLLPVLHSPLQWYIIDATVTQARLIATSVEQSMTAGDIKRDNAAIGQSDHAMCWAERWLLCLFYSFEPLWTAEKWSEILSMEGTMHSCLHSLPDLHKINIDYKDTPISREIHFAAWMKLHIFLTKWKQYSLPHGGY